VDGVRFQEADMPALFSYGTLQEAGVQLATFGRRLDGRRDALVAFESSLVAIDDAEVAARLGKTHHANVVANGDDASRVTGTVFDLTDAELASADVFEHEFAYVRINTTLESGTEAWVYVAIART
jgi:gamma-glutamylcyclotransferase (GGCT)/AIG2-like uncharacterized protein YtfP